MKLIHFNAATLLLRKGGGNKSACVSFAKSGIITFNPAAVELMGLTAEDKVTLSQDEAEPENWYFFKDENGFELRTGYKDKGLLFNHVTMVKQYLEALGLDTSITHRLLIAGKATMVKNDKTKYWGVIAMAR